MTFAFYLTYFMSLDGDQKISTVHLSQCTLIMNRMTCLLIQRQAMIIQSTTLVTDSLTRSTCTYALPTRLKCSGLMRLHLITLSSRPIKTSSTPWGNQTLPALASIKHLFPWPKCSQEWAHCWRKSLLTKHCLYSRIRERTGVESF